MNHPVPHASRRKGNCVPSRWTAEHDQMLRKLNGDGRIDSEIAAVIGFSETYVCVHRLALGLAATRGGWTEERIATAARLWVDEKMTAGEISAALNCGLSRNAVIGKIHRLGLARGQGKAAAGPRRPHLARSPPAKAKHAAEPAAAPPIVVDFARLFAGPMPAELPSLNLTIRQLDNHTCRWTSDEVLPFLFCGHATFPGTPYGACHARRCYQAPQRRRVA